MDHDQHHRPHHRFEREFARVATVAPWIGKLRQPGWTLLRVLAAVMLIFGGILAVLPVLGLWMIPLGLMLLAIDIPILQEPLAALIIRARWIWHNLRMRWRRK